jgi:membrane protein
MRDRFRHSFVGRCLARYDRINGAQQGGFIALNALLGLVPIVLMTTVLIRRAGSRSVRIDDLLIRLLHLSGPAVRSIHGAFTTTPRQAKAITIVAVIGGATTLIGFCGSIWRLFNAALDRSRLPGLRASVKGVLWLAVTTGFITAIQFVSIRVEKLHGPIHRYPVAEVIRVVGATVIWLITPRLLVSRRIRWQQLLPGALVGGLSSGLVILLSRLYVPGLLNSYAVPFGAFGVAIALGFWLWTIAGVIVIGAVVMGELSRLDESADPLTTALPSGAATG